MRKAVNIMKMMILTNNLERASFRQRIGVYLKKIESTGIVFDVQKIPSGFFKRLGLYRKCKEYDLVFLQKKRISYIDGFFLRRNSKKIVYDFDDAVMYRDDVIFRPSDKRLRDFERTVKLADTVIAGNFYLAEHALKYNKNIKTLPTGLDIDNYDLPKPTSDGKIRLVWIGSTSTLKYLDELRPVLEEIGKKYPNVILRIICDSFFDLKNMMVEKREWSLNGQYLGLVSADIGLAPLPDTPFTRGKCGFKILQYSAAGLCTVTSDVGVNGEIVEDGVSGFVVKDANGWISRISQLIEDSALRAKMGNQAKCKVQKFDINVLVEKFIEILKI